MNKKLKNLFLAGALVLGFAGMAVSCKDYQPDIDALDTRLAKVESALQDLQNQIKAGYILTNVTSGADGSVTLTLNNGSNYTIPAGKDGAAGAKGEKGDKGDKG
ncbi:MAG: hypothetical protein IKH49_10035, partial [Bacteroidales bacterium]|nr:hypothetical protein [Bacteroidales bacterium]